MRSVSYPALEVHASGAIASVNVENSTDSSWSTWDEKRDRGTITWTKHQHVLETLN